MCVNAIDTMDTLENQAKALQSVYKLQSATINSSLENDCTNHGANGACLSVGGRYSSTDAPSADSTGLMLTGAYRFNERFRLGAFVDTSVSSSAPSGMSLERRTPLWGLFGSWQAETGGLGPSVRLAYARNKADLKVGRPEVPGILDPFSEPGEGKGSFTSEAASVVGHYGFAVAERWQAVPYVGIRHTRLKLGSYSEDPVGLVAPLTYDSLELKSTSLLAGVRLNGQLTGNLILNAGLGMEYDLDNNNPSYRATGLAGLTPIAFNADKSKTRPVASLGMSYQITANQALGLRAMYRQEVFDHSESVVAYATYSIGF